ncbi:Uncharacterised protein [Mycobacteroides abscessus subsp. abscessus]|nr:Uncharacterised protein [Mycobacteroides abscessus]SHU79602.1 Uncharacterised protein [Mycobacteroides abscessus subsp. abscessus]
MMTGAAIPTVCPSASWNWPLTFAVGTRVVNAPDTGTALPSRPTAEPFQVYFTSNPSGSVVWNLV